jgi:putative sterol carrier protein
MTGATAEFFEELGQRGHEPLLQSVTGTLRFDVENGKRVEHWFVTVDKGDVAVSRRDAHADAVVRADRTLADGMASGNVNPMAAVLRGAAEVRGDLGLVMSFQRLFPGPPRSRTKSGSARQRSAR